MGTRVIAIGQRAAGDDAVGLAVLERLRRVALPHGTELVEVGDATALLPLLETRHSVIVVDAVVGSGPVGEVVEVDGDALESSGEWPVSSHGVGVAQALALARVLDASSFAPSVSVVGVRIEAPRRFTHGLSDEVARAIPKAVSAVVARIGGG